MKIAIIGAHGHEELMVALVSARFAQITAKTLPSIGYEIIEEPPYVEQPPIEVSPILFIDESDYRADLLELIQLEMKRRKEEVITLTQAFIESIPDIPYLELEQRIDFLTPKDVRCPLIRREPKVRKGPARIRPPTNRKHTTLLIKEGFSNALYYFPRSSTSSMRI